MNTLAMDDYPSPIVDPGPFGKEEGADEGGRVPAASVCDRAGL
jgi:hypothetical protein